MSGLLRKLRSLFRQAQPHEFAIKILQDGSGFNLERDLQSIGTLRLDEVKEIFAFKRDLFGVDLICFGFRTNDDGTYWEVDEEMSGYADLLKLLEARFGIMPEHWFSKVAFPAFEPNLTSLWGEPYPYKSE